MAIQFVVL